MNHDHVSSDVNIVIPLLPLRDQIVRFMHRILQHVQRDRQILEQEYERRKQMKAAAALDTSTTTNGTTSTTTTSKKRMRPILTFIIVLSGQVEMYKSMILTLLASAGNGGSITSSYCGLRLDIQAMLKLQLEEIMDDQYEKLQH
jgi:hypothetical protein